MKKNDKLNRYSLYTIFILCVRLKQRKNQQLFIVFYTFFYCFSICSDSFNNVSRFNQSNAYVILMQIVLYKRNDVQCVLIKVDIWSFFHPNFQVFLAVDLEKPFRPYIGKNDRQLQLFRREWLSESARGRSGWAGGVGLGGTIGSPISQYADLSAAHSYSASDPGISLTW